MKRLFILFISFAFYFVQSYSQTYALDNSVQLTATSSTGPDAVTLQWLSYPGATQYNVYRKIPSAITWGTPIATLTSIDSTYIDNTVINGTLYEYRVDRIAPTTAYGYVMSGVNTRLNYNNGIILLLVDSFFIPTLNADIAQLISDYEADGWFVKQLNINRNNTVAAVKNQIITLYNQDIANTKTLMLLGHIPVPYAGLINPDGHPDHYGAWPADVFYADMDGIWTDVSIADDSSASDPRNHNIPGDGKYDQSTLPSNTELQIGRVDFYNLPTFSESETQLMSNYLNKLHAFKIRGFIPNDIALVEDNFGGYAEGFSSSGYKNFSTTVGPSNIFTGDWLAGLDTMNALWSYGCGGGWYQGAGGICTSSDFANDSVLSVFNMLFGSYFGDWDVQNSFLRAPLASGTILTNVWAGRPHWQFHQMAMGYPIGYSAQKTQNNSSTYFTSNLAPGYFGRWIHIALMGDPALRMHYIAPPSALGTAEDVNHLVHLTWSISPETVDGYHVYRKLATDLNWIQINNSIIPGTSYIDSTLTSGGDYKYMVRAVRTQQTASGTYQNLSLGFMADLSSHLTIENIQNNGFNLYPNPATEQITLHIHHSTPSESTVFIYNSLGEMVQTNILPTTTNQLIIDITGLKTGVYYIETGNYTGKFVKK